MSTHDIVVYLILSAGLLAMPIGAFGLLDAMAGNRRGSHRVTVLIGTYAVGIMLGASALVLAGRWYLGVPLVLMLFPVETALRKHGVLARRTAASKVLDTTNR